MQVARSTDFAFRVLATLGPQPVETLVDAANRSRQPTAKLPPVLAADLELGLRHRGATHDPYTGRWTAPTGTAPTERDVQLVDALRAAGPRTRVELRQVLINVGYTLHSPQTTIVDRHPLIRRTAPNRYELLT